MDTSCSLSDTKTKDELLARAHQARQARELARKQEQAAVTLQAHVRSHLARQKLKSDALTELQVLLSSDGKNLNATRLLGAFKRWRMSSKSGTDKQTILVNLMKLIESQYAGKDTGKHANLLASIICDCLNNGQSKLGWIDVLDYLLSFALDSIIKINGVSTSEDTADLALYLGRVNQFTICDKFMRLEKETSDKVEQLLVADEICMKLRERSEAKRKDVFFELTEVMCRLIKGPKTDLKATILDEYVQMAAMLLESRSANNHEPSRLSKLNNQASVKLLRFQSQVLTNFLSIPCIIHYIEQYGSTKQDLSVIFKNSKFFKNSLSVLNEHDQPMQNLTSTPALCLSANLIHLASLDCKVLEHETVIFCKLITKLFEICQRNVRQKVVLAQGIGRGVTHKKAPVDNATDESYNHILGWLARETGPTLDQEVSRLIKSQLSHLWSCKILKILFMDLDRINEKLKLDNCASKRESKHNSSSKEQLNVSSSDSCSMIGSQRQNHQQSVSMASLRKALERAASTISKTINSSYLKSSAVSLLGSSGSIIGFMSDEAKKIALVCYMLNSALKTLRMIRQDVLTGLCLNDYILRDLWTFISSLSPADGMRAYLSQIVIHPKADTPEFHILMLFCECTSHIISILDDSELYEQQKIFTLDQLVSISLWLNLFIYTLITHELVDCNTDGSSSQMTKCDEPFLQATHKLLTHLYKRDCRRKFAPQDHWMILRKESKISVLLRDLEQGKPVARATLRLLPFIIPHKVRVLIFRKLVAQDKKQHCSRQCPFSTFITIHRSRLVEDGYQQLARVPPVALKGIIRVKFINDLGLDEAGIDQDGVFKEFLEDTIKRVFDPALNLFASTSEQRLYPSPTSRLHEDHLSLFNFVGKMLGKAVYEGIVVDVPFATFFLSRVLSKPQSPLYSPIDELPSLDAELYKSLTYIKHYDGDVSQLDLTFSLDQEFMGKIETHELEPGGRFIPVTKETRVRYIHSVANFRMRTQIEEQTEAFVRGFKSIVDIEWLSMFSESEFQRLISGDTSPIDLHDLRQHTYYFGGFHNSHRVICWLWDILERDFTPQEHRLFLKFVTSCSKPPLLGFANLQPPFSIRCVEVSDDQDSGDTVGSVLRGFFAIRRSDPVDRLPTSSTCFNLLKLPNYQRRSTLREKLRYAIQSSTGFELS